LRILGMIASPDDLPPLNVERERQRVERAVASIQESGLVELTWLQGGTWQDLQRAMRKGPWHIFHFVGHGRFDVNQDEGVVALVGEHGETDDLTASQIGRLLADHPSLRLVMLNACEGARGGKKDIFSGTAATLVRRGIPAVVAMQYEITDRAAIEFARTFYEAVSDEMPLDAAVAEAQGGQRVDLQHCRMGHAGALHALAGRGPLPGAGPAEGAPERNGGHPDSEHSDDSTHCAVRP
jgi:CHAT domain-containing protein